MMSVEEFALEEDNFLSKRLPIKKVLVTIFSHGNKVIDTRIEFTGDNLLWERIMEKSMFSYKEDICGPIMGGRFKNNKDFVFTIGLKPDQVTILSILAEGPSNALKTLLSAEHNPAFHDFTSYRLLAVMQNVTPKTQWGMTTSYYKMHEQ